MKLRKMKAPLRERGRTRLSFEDLEVCFSCICPESLITLEVHRSEVDAFGFACRSYEGHASSRPEVADSSARDDDKHCSHEGICGSEIWHRTVCLVFSLSLCTIFSKKHHGNNRRQ